MACQIDSVMVEDGSSRVVGMNSEVQPDSNSHALLQGSELKGFRTKQCPLYVRGVCPDSRRCRLSHSETWPRRNPSLFKYGFQLCPNIQFAKTADKLRLSGKCNYGRKCKFSHSKEEQLYHPDLYKTRMCTNHPNCKAYFCPFAHSAEELRIKRKPQLQCSQKKSNSCKNDGMSRPMQVRVRDPVEAVPPAPEEQPTVEVEPPVPEQVALISNNGNDDNDQDNHRNNRNLHTHLVEAGTCKSTSRPRTLMATREVLGIADIGLTVLEETIFLQDDVDDYIEFFNKYVSHISGIMNAGVELAISLASSTDYGRILLLAGAIKGLRRLEYMDEDEWFDEVVRAGIRLLEDYGEDPQEVKFDLRNLCLGCLVVQGACHLHSVSEVPMF